MEYKKKKLNDSGFKRKCLNPVFSSDSVLPTFDSGEKTPLFQSLYPSQKFPYCVNFQETLKYLIIITTQIFQLRLVILLFDLKRNRANSFLTILKNLSCIKRWRYPDRFKVRITLNGKAHACSLCRVTPLTFCIVLAYITCQKSLFTS